MQDHILQVQLFLRDSYEADPFVALTEQYGIKVRKYPEDNLVLLDYDQIESPKTHPIVVECRSLILALDTLEVVSEFAQKQKNRFSTMNMLTGTAFDHSTFTHKDILVGEWKYPPLFDRIFRGVKPQFIRKSE